MRALLRFSLPVCLVTLATACGGNDYDAAYGCEQQVACARQKGKPPLDRAACEKDATTYYQSLSRARQKEANKTFAACRSRTGCDFDACLLER